MLEWAIQSTSDGYMKSRFQRTQAGNLVEVFFCVCFVLFCFFSIKRQNGKVRRFLFCMSHYIMSAFKVCIFTNDHKFWIKSKGIFVVDITIQILLTLPFFTQSQSATVYFFCTISYTVAVCACVFHLYDFFLLLLLSSSVNTSLTYISDITLPISTRLGHKYRLTTPFMSHDQIRVKGHVGVTGVKKVIFTKNATPTDYVAWSCDLCMW